MSEARALTNLVGNGVATIVVGKWCGDLDQARMRQVLDNKATEDAEDGDAGLHQELPVANKKAAELI
jgi:aerobic C4-dicarboxylate transport protein